MNMYIISGTTLYLFIFIKYVKCCPNIDIYHDYAIKEEFVDRVFKTGNAARCGHSLYQNQDLKAATAVQLGDGFLCYLTTKGNYCREEKEWTTAEPMIGAITYTQPCCHFYMSGIANYIIRPLINKDNYLEFEAKVHAELFIGLFSKRLYKSDWIFIVVDGWSKEQSMLQQLVGYNDYGGHFRQAEVKITVFVEGTFLTADKFVKYWLRWDNDLVQLGINGSTAPFLKAAVQLDQPITHIGFTSAWGHKGMVRYKCDCFENFYGSRNNVTS